MNRTLGGDPLRRLESDLREALKHRGTDDRMAAGKALGAVLEWLYDAQPEWAAQGLHRPLYELLVALDDPNKGRVAAMLKPPPGWQTVTPTARIAKC